LAKKQTNQKIKKINLLNFLENKNKIKEQEI